MLKIKNKHHLDFSHIIEELMPARQLQFQTVLDDDDDLTQAISSDTEVQDNNWQLVECPDPVELIQFWSQVQEEVKLDPEWTFEEE